MRAEELFSAQGTSPFQVLAASRTLYPAISAADTGGYDQNGREIGMRKGTGKRRGEEGYGEGEVQLGDSDEVLMDEEEMVQHLLDTFNSAEYSPPRLPTVAMEIMNLSQKADVALEEFVSLLEQDAMLAGQVMKLVRSPVYAGGAEITSLKQALVRIGVKNLRDLVFEASMNMRVFKSDAYKDSMDRLRQHSSIAAQIARIICKYTAIEGEYAFLCGLLHDVGIAGTLIALSEGAKKAAPDLIAIWPAVERVHPDAGSQMTKLWELPMELQMVLGAHHQVVMEGFVHPMAATICLADHLAHEAGYGLTPKGESVEGVGELEGACLESHHKIDHSSEKTVKTAIEGLGLSEKQLDLIRADIEKLGETD